MPAHRTSPATQWDVVVIGGANTDYLVRGSMLPQPGETVQGDVFEPRTLEAKARIRRWQRRGSEHAWLLSGVSGRMPADAHY